jgi:hypothetical protein
MEHPQSPTSNDQQNQEAVDLLKEIMAPVSVIEAPEPPLEIVDCDSFNLQMDDGDRVWIVQMEFNQLRFYDKLMKTIKRFFPQDQDELQHMGIKGDVFTVSKNEQKIVSTKYEYIAIHGYITHDDEEVYFWRWCWNENPGHRLTEAKSNMPERLANILQDRHYTFAEEHSTVYFKSIASAFGNYSYLVNQPLPTGSAEGQEMRFALMGLYDPVWEAPMSEGACTQVPAE